MADEKKPIEVNPQPPEGGEKKPSSEPNPTPSVEELQKQIQELQNQQKDKDAKIADLENTRATIEARQRKIEQERDKKTADEDLKKRISQINERRVYDPEGADSEMASLLEEVKSQSSKDAVLQAQSIITQQTAIEKLKQGIKSTNPEFDDDVIDVIMQRADSLAQTGKYKTAEEAIKAATDFVKTKFDSYAKTKNSAPPLPEGALAEAGGNKLPDKPKVETVPTPEEEIESRKAGMQKKIL